MAHQIPLEMRLLSEGKLRKETKKRTLGNTDKLGELWDDYKAGVLSGIDLLEEAARVVKRK